MLFVSLLFGQLRCAFFFFAATTLCAESGGSPGGRGGHSSSAAEEKKRVGVGVLNPLVVDCRRKLTREIYCAATQPTLRTPFFFFTRRFLLSEIFLVHESSFRVLSSKNIFLKFPERIFNMDFPRGIFQLEKIRFVCSKFTFDLRFPPRGNISKKNAQGNISGKTRKATFPRNFVDRDPHQMSVGLRARSRA